MMVVFILFVCVSLSQGLIDVSNCSATKCMQCFTGGEVSGNSLQIDCDVKNISGNQYEISCGNIINGNCTSVDVLPEKGPHYCLYHLNFLNGVWKFVATKFPFEVGIGIGNTCDNVQAVGFQGIISPNCTGVFQRSSISEIYDNPYLCYCYNDNCNELNTITVEITTKDTPSSVEFGVNSSVINILPSIVHDTTHVITSTSLSTTRYDTTHVTISASSSTTGYDTMYVTTSTSSSTTGYDTTHVTSSTSSGYTTGYINFYITSSSSFPSLPTPLSSSYSLLNTTSSPTQTTPSKNTVPASEVAYIIVIGILSMLVALTFFIFLIVCYCHYKKRTTIHITHHSNNQQYITPSPPLYDMETMNNNSFKILVNEADTKYCSKEDCKENQKDIKEEH